MPPPPRFSAAGWALGGGGFAGCHPGGLDPPLCPGRRLGRERGSPQPIGGGGHGSCTPPAGPQDLALGEEGTDGQRCVSPAPCFLSLSRAGGDHGCAHTHRGNLAGSVPLGFGCPKIRGSGLGKVRGSGAPAPQPAERGWLEGEGRALRAGKMLHRMEGWGPCRSAWGGPAHPQPGAGGSRGCCRRLRVSLGPFVLCGAVLSRGCSPLPGAAGSPELPLPAAALPHCTRAAIPRGAPAEGGDAHRGGQQG